MKTLQVIMAHAEGQHIFDRHLPYWQRSNPDIVVFCPCDSVVRTHYPVICYGNKSHHDAMANRRFKELLRFLRVMRFEQFLIHEYDSLCIDPQSPDFHVGYLWANVWQNTEPARFKGSHYFHPPLLFNWAILNLLNLALSEIPDESEEGFWDRLLGVAVDKGGVPFRPYAEKGFSRNTIEQQDIPAAIEARKAGATMFHGIKSGEVLRRIIGL